MIRFTEQLSIKKTVILISVVTAVFRAVCAFLLELGNDEVYYWCYAMFPSMSHFDHPPMVGLLIQTTTGGLIFDSELFIRLSSVLIGSVNTWLMYIICRMIKNEITGLYAALLYTASIYCSIIVGTMIMPDSPLSTFFLLAMYFMHESVIAKHDNTNREAKHLRNHALILGGFFTGLAMLSKYTGAFLWIGYGLYILLYDRKELKNPYLYVAVLVSGICFLPVLWWNYNNDFISFTFHQSRTNGFEGFNLLYFGRELLGSFIYNNPVNVVLMVIALTQYKKVKYMKKEQMRFFIMFSLPIILTFMALSMFKPTLPHWSAPGYFALMIIAASYLSEINKEEEIRFPKVLKSGICLTAVIMAAATIQIRTGFIDITTSTAPETLGRKDITLDMYGWHQLGSAFEEIRNADIRSGAMPESSYILAENWFPAAHYDYYVGHPIAVDVKTIGPLERTHKYAWITEQRGGIHLGDNAYYIESSRHDGKASVMAEKYFENYELARTVAIKRRNKTIMYYKIYRLKNLTQVPEDKLICGHRKSCEDRLIHENDLFRLNN